MGQPKISYIVLDAEELISVCTKPELDKINAIIERMIRKREAQGQKAATGFIVVEADKPYAPAIAEIIHLHENQKEETTDEDSQQL